MGRFSLSLTPRIAVKTALVAYRLMLEVVHVDGAPSRDESELLESYRRKLRIRKRKARRMLLMPRPDVSGCSEREREAVLRAATRAAYADGELTEREAEHLHEVAGWLGVGEVQLANMMRDAEHMAAGSRTHRAAGWRMVAVVAAIFLSGAALMVALRGDPADAAELRAVVEQHDPGLLLIHVAYDLVRDGERLEFQGIGTGFFVSDDGLLVTNKHVVEPWKFLADRRQKIDAGYGVDAVHLTAWPVGARVMERRGQLAFEDAYSTRGGTLDVVKGAPDHWVRSQRKLSNKEPYVSRYHALDSSDLVVLKADVGSPVHAIPLAGADAPVRPLDSVVVLGFPRGIHLLEAMHAVSSPSLGVVRKVEETVLVSAPIYPGNSGGPLLNARGEVIGIASRRALNEAGLGSCIQVKHLHALLE